MDRRFTSDLEGGGNVQVPKRFDSQEDAAKFFDTTDLTELADGELVETKVDVSPRGPLNTTFAIRLDRQTIDKLREIASLFDVGATQLVRSWILERLTIEEQAGALAERHGELPSELELTVRQEAIAALMRQVGPVAEGALERAIAHLDAHQRAIENDDDEKSAQAI